MVPVGGCAGGHPALPIRTRRISKELAFGRDLRRRRKAACGAARLAGANSNCGPMPHRAVPTVCQKRTIPWRWSFWSTASAERAAPNRCEAGKLRSNGIRAQKKRLTGRSPGTALKVRNAQQSSHEPFGSHFLRTTFFSVEDMDSSGAEKFMS